MNLNLSLPCILIFTRCQYRIFGRLDDYDLFRSRRKVFHHFSEVAEPQKVELPILNEVILYPLLQVLYFGGQFELFFFERFNLTIEIVNLATDFRIFCSSNPTQFVFVHFFNIPNSL